MSTSAYPANSKKREEIEFMVGTEGAQTSGSHSIVEKILPLTYEIRLIIE